MIRNLCLQFETMKSEIAFLEIHLLILCVLSETRRHRNLLFLTLYTFQQQQQQQLNITKLDVI